MFNIFKPKDPTGICSNAHMASPPLINMIMRFMPLNGVVGYATREQIIVCLWLFAVAASADDGLAVVRGRVILGLRVFLLPYWLQLLLYRMVWQPPSTSRVKSSRFLGWVKPKEIQLRFDFTQFLMNFNKLSFSVDVWTQFDIIEM